MFRSLFLVMIISFSYLNAYEYRAYGIGGDPYSSKVAIEIKGEVYTLLSFSDNHIKQEETSISAESILLVGVYNGKKIMPIQLSSDYKNQNIIVKVFKSKSTFDESTLVTQSEEMFLDEEMKQYSISLD